jgi:hypothetical protein
MIFTSISPTISNLYLFQIIFPLCLTFVGFILSLMVYFKLEKIGGLYQTFSTDPFGCGLFSLSASLFFAIGILLIFSLMNFDRKSILIDTFISYYFIVCLDIVAVQTVVVNVTDLNPAIPDGDIFFYSIPDAMVLSDTSTVQSDKYNYYCFAPIVSQNEPNSSEFWVLIPTNRSTAFIKAWVVCPLLDRGLNTPSVN